MADDISGDDTRGTHKGGRYAGTVTHLTQPGWKDKTDDMSDQRKELLHDGTLRRQNNEGEYEEVEFEPPGAYWLTPPEENQEDL